MYKAVQKRGARNIESWSKSCTQCISQRGLPFMKRIPGWDKSLLSQAMLVVYRLSYLGEYKRYPCSMPSKYSYAYLYSGASVYEALYTCYCLIYTCVKVKICVQISIYSFTFIHARMRTAITSVTHILILVLRCISK